MTFHANTFSIFVRVLRLQLLTDRVVQYIFRSKTVFPRGWASVFKSNVNFGKIGHEKVFSKPDFLVFLGIS